MINAFVKEEQGWSFFPIWIYSVSMGKESYLNQTGIERKKNRWGKKAYALSFSRRSRIHYQVWASIIFQPETISKLSILFQYGKVITMLPWWMQFWYISLVIKNFIKRISTELIQSISFKCYHCQLWQHPENHPGI